MKKRVMAVFTAIIIIAGVLTPHMTAGAENSVKSGDWEYAVENGTARIKKYTGMSQTADIPKTIDGKRVTGIKWGAFSNSAVTAVTIPYSVTSIYVSAFYGCTKLTSITVDDNNGTYSSKDGVLLDKDGKTLIFWPLGKTVSNIPDVTGIGRSAFYGCASLTAFTIGNNVTSIGDYAFNGSGLSSAEIPESVKSIDYGAFYNCANLTSVTFKSSTPPDFLSYKVFENCPNLKTVYVPSGAKDAYGKAADLKKYNITEK